MKPVRRKTFLLEGIGPGTTARGPLQVMDYSLQRAISLAESHGWRDVKEMPRHRFVVDSEALRHAQSYLGLTWPVRVRTHSRPGRKNGEHSLSYPGATRRNGKLYGLDTARPLPRHEIMLKTYLTAEQAGEVLWHELTHAQQAERVVKAAGGKTAREMHLSWLKVLDHSSGVKYDKKPHEVEAHANQRLNRIYPLAKEA